MDLETTTDADGAGTSEPGDRELLAAYLDRQDEQAFTRLVRRHQDMVHSACVRRLGRLPIAEDAVQTTFLLLAQRARQLRTHASVGGWLYKTALFQSSNLLRKEQSRRRLHEKWGVEPTAKTEDTSAASGNEPTLAETMRPHLDEALLKLGEADREAVVLRFFCKRSLSEIGSLLGTTEDAARKRVSRALDRLSGFLRRRRVEAGTVAALALALTQSTQAAPPDLAVKVTAMVHGTSLVGQATAATALWLKCLWGGTLLATMAGTIAWQARTYRQLHEEVSAVNAEIESRTAVVHGANLSPPAELSAGGTSGAAGYAAQPTNALPSLMAAMWAEESRAGTDARLQLLQERVRLDTAQAEAASVLLRQSLEARQKLVAGLSEGLVEFERVMDFLRAGSEADAAIRGLLRADQVDGFNVFLVSESKARAENAARWRLADLRSLLHLTKDQEPAVQRALVEHGLAFAPESLPAVQGFHELQQWLSARDADEAERLRPLLTPEQHHIYQERSASLRTNAFFNQP